MRRMIFALGGAAFGSLLLVAAVAAADPTPSPSPATSARIGTVANVLGLTQAQIHDLRNDGLSISQIAAQHGVDVQKVADALVAQWKERIAARLANGALTQAEAAALEAKLKTQAQTMVSSTMPGGMQGAAVGAGPANSNGAGNGDTTRARDGSGTGTGDCDGTGPHGPGHP